MIVGKDAVEHVVLFLLSTQLFLLCTLLPSQFITHLLQSVEQGYNHVTPFQQLLVRLHGLSFGVLLGNDLLQAFEMALEFFNFLSENGALLVE